MNNLIINNNDKLTMSSRDIAIHTAKAHKNVKRDIVNMLDELVEDKLKFERTYIDVQNRAQTEFVLDKDHTLTLVSGYSAHVRRNIIRRWLDIESNLDTAHQIPRTLSQALMLAANQAEKIEKQSEQLKLAAPKVDFVNRFVDSNGNKSFREVAKVLKANEREFRAFLVEFKVMYQLGKKYTAYQSHVEAGRFYVTTGEKNGHAYTDCKFTPKGIEYIAGKWVTHSNK